MAESRFDLVIFDCDGVVMDSERVVHEIFGNFIRSLGARLDAARMNELFPGRRRPMLSARSRIGASCRLYSPEPHSQPRSSLFPISEQARGEDGHSQETMYPLVRTKTRIVLHPNGMLKHLSPRPERFLDVGASPTAYKEHSHDART
jgi:phosphoglycolate phosphatase-like HAD superfamily hydrolase